MKWSLIQILLVSSVISFATQSTGTPAPTEIPSVTLSGHSAGVTKLAWSPDGSILASSAGYFDSQDNTVRLWQTDGQVLAVLSGHTQPVSALAWSPDSTVLATGSHDETINLWQKDGKQIQTIQAKTGIVFALAWSPDGTTLASGSIAGFNRNTVQLWNKNGQLLHTMTTQYSGGKFYNLAWSPDGKFLVGGATDYSEWKADGTLVFNVESCAHCPPAWGFAWSPDSHYWAIGNESGLIWVYNTKGKEMAQMQSTEGVNQMQWSPDGKWLADTKNLWKVQGSKFVLKNYVKGLDALDWSQDSQYIASASDTTVYIQQADGKLVLSLKGHTKRINTLAWSPKGDILASGAEDHTIRLWNLSALHK